jgi:phosphodiesterase/alkaline phosphatase D-like protein
VPWIITWNDREVANDHVGDVVSEQDDDDVEAFRTRRAAVYTRSMPVCRSTLLMATDYTIFQSFAHDGDLVTFPELDTRQYRSDQQRNVPVVAPRGHAEQLCNETLCPTTPATRCSAPGSDRGCLKFRRIERGVECAL